MKVFVILALVLVVLVVIIMVTGIGGEHGPGRHMTSGNPGGSTPVRTPGGGIPPEAEPVRA